MALLLLGLILFLGLHSVRIVAEGWRARTIARIGEGAWKGLYSLVSIAGFVLLVVGYGQARQHTVALWSPPRWTHDLAGLLTLAAFVMVTAAYVPGNAIKARLGDPMILGVKTWALAHLLANGSAVDVLLFGSFLAWAVFDFRAARRRRAAAPATAAPASGGAHRDHRGGGRRGVGRVRVLAARPADRRAAVRLIGLSAPRGPRGRCSRAGVPGACTAARGPRA